MSIASVDASRTISKLYTKHEVISNITDVPADYSELSLLKEKLNRFEEGVRVANRGYTYSHYIYLLKITLKFNT